MFGVWMCPLPSAAMVSKRCWSVMTNSTFGFSRMT